MKIVSFILLELVAVATCVGSVVAGVATHFGDQSFGPLLTLIPIVAAVVATVLPIVYFGFAAQPRRTAIPTRES